MELCNKDIIQLEDGNEYLIVEKIIYKTKEYLIMIELKEMKKIKIMEHCIEENQDILYVIREKYRKI